MKIKVTCPYCKDTTILTCTIDTQGDPSVGLDPAGLEDVSGNCIHATAISEDLEGHDEDTTKMYWSKFAEALNKELDNTYQKDREWESATRSEEEDYDDGPR